MTRVPLSVAVLAGGQSTRMGQEKARLSIDGVPLIARVIAAVTQLEPVDGITIVGGDSDLIGLAAIRSSPTPVLHVSDDFPGEGPLGGIITALRAAKPQNYVLTVACDLPDLHVPALRHLVSETHATDADIGVPLTNGRRQWHVAVWHPRCLSQLESSFTSGTRSIWKAAAPLRQTVIISSRVNALTDLDTPSDVDGFLGSM